MSSYAAQYTAANHIDMVSGLQAMNSKHNWGIKKYYSPSRVWIKSHESLMDIKNISKELMLVEYV